MLARLWLTAVLSTSALLCGACSGDEAGEALPAVSSAVVVDNGTSLNGTSLNGTSLNGTSLNGTSLNGTSLNGADLHATGPGGVLLHGDDLVGATMTGVRGDGSHVVLRIDDITPTPDPEVYLYEVSYQAGPQWASICGYANGQAIPAIPLQGTWDESAGTPTGGDHIDEPGMITFACVHSALAKCVGLGYMPWRSVQECKKDGGCQMVPLRPFHQACTRMLRADYCGDGTPHTLSNVPVNVWDDFGIQKRSKVGGGWVREAEWTPDGAACVSELRYDPAGATSSYLADHCPGRLSASFACFGADSTFATKVGYSTPLLERSLLRVEFDQADVLSRADDAL